MTSRSLDAALLVGHVAGPFAPRPPASFTDAPNDPELPVRTGPNGVSQRLPDISSIAVRYSLDLDRAAAELRDLLLDVVSEITGPVMATLSSGMDSSSVVACLAQNRTPVVAVTMTTPGPSDETRWARTTAQHLDVELIEVEIEPDQMLPPDGVVTRQDSPLFNMFESGWTMMGSTAKRLGIDRIVTGLSGDLLFGGWVSPGGDLLLRARGVHAFKYVGRQRHEYPSLRRTIRAEVVGPIARQAFPTWWAKRATPVPWLHASRIPTWRKLQRASVRRGLAPGLAVRRDRVVDGSMQQLAEQPTLTDMAIAQLHPLLDARLVEFALSLPTWLLYDGGLDKLVLREAMRGILPSEIIGLENVIPGETAVKAMRARKGPLLSLARNMKAAEIRIVSEEPLRAEVESFMRGEHDSMAFWNALTLEDWLRRWQ